MSDFKLVGSLGKCFMYVVTMVIIVEERCKLVHSDVMRFWIPLGCWAVGLLVVGLLGCPFSFWRSYCTHTSRGPTVHTLVEVLLYTH